MSETVKDGGAAFPMEFHGGEGSWREEGMSLRDWFAGQALGAMVAAVYSGDITSTKHGLSEDGIAEQAYAFADAMLAERAKAGGSHEE